MKKLQFMILYCLVFMIGKYPKGGGAMVDDFNMKQMVDDDILYCKEFWKNYSHDKDKMEELFYRMLFKYIDKIDSIAEGMNVVTNYEHSGEIAGTYRTNISVLIERLENFRNNHYSNEGLSEYYLNMDSHAGYQSNRLNVSFNEVRLSILEMKDVNVHDKDIIIEKIDLIEDIIQQKKTKKERWDMLRPQILWLSGKDVDVGLKILPLFLKLD